MNIRRLSIFQLSLAPGIFALTCACVFSAEPPQESAVEWREKAAEYARIMSGVRWTPVAEGMPKRGGYFEKGNEYSGVPYSSVKSVGRDIGYDIFLKTFLAAVENPKSVLYTENLYGTVSNAECYYGKVCSTFTSYALQCGFWNVSRLHGPDYREGVVEINPPKAGAARAGDVIFTPPAKKGGGSHIEIVTAITRDDDGKVTHVLIEESRPLTTRITDRPAEDFETHLTTRDRKLYRITDLEAWRGVNQAESLLFPNYEEDSATPEINRVLLLDRGDWVPYYKGQIVKFNIMDQDSRGVKTLVIKRGDSVVEEIDDPGKGVVEREFSECGDYTAHCVLKDGSLSAACEFAVCDLDLEVSGELIATGEPWEIKFTSDNMNPVIVHLMSKGDSYGRHNVFITKEDRENGRVVIPADVIQSSGGMQAWLIGENRYGRLKKVQDLVAE